MRRESYRARMKSFRERIRTGLILGRVSNLPTVWSNLLVGWLMVGEIDPVRLMFVLVGGSLLYVGGMYLNDFCDAEFDAQFCSNRPIPSGKISRWAVGMLAILWFIMGLTCLAPLGGVTAGVALLLTAAIVLYDFRHKNVSWAPLVMGVCRFLLYPLAASVVVNLRVLGYVIPAALALGLYVAGITYLARGESRPDKPARWALLFLVSPIFVSVAFFIEWPFHDGRPLPFCVLLLAWMAWLLVPFWLGKNRSIGRLVSGLLAGIVLVDMIAVAPVLGLASITLLPLFLLALLLQRVIPAT